jgi:hypothetical protein
MSDFKDRLLKFYDNKIVDTVRYTEVMMDWEAPIMEKSAEYICQSKGDILEIGFGMGICSDYIQAQGVNSHTIVEIHPQIIEKLKEWVIGKDNVIIVEGDWYTSELSAYDGIFLDTYGDDNFMKLKEFTMDHANNNAHITYWNNEQSKENKYNFDNISWGYLNITPEPNNYSKIDSRYYIPRVINNVIH